MKKSFIFFLFLFLFSLTYAMEEVSSYNLYVQLNPEKFTINGYIEINYVNNTNLDLSEIYFFLPANMGKKDNPHLHPIIKDSSYLHGFDPAYTEVRNIFDKNGNILNYSLEKGKILFQDYSLEDNYLRVFLPSPLSPKESFYLKILFSTKFPKTYMKDMSFAKDSFIWRFGWFPQELKFIDGKWDKGGRLPSCNFNIELLVPKDYVAALGVDEQKETLVNENWKKIIGKNYSPKRSLPMALSKKYLVYKPILQMTPEISLYFYPGREYKARILANYAQEILSFYKSLYGPLKHKRIVIVEGQTEGFWGMTADNFVLLGNSVFYSSDLFTPFLFERINEWLLAHELAHLWWGIGVGIDFDWENWISEGLTQYSSIYYFEKKYGAKGGNLFPNLGDDYFLNYLKDSILGEWNLRESLVEYPYLTYLRDGWDEPIVKDYWNSNYNGYSDKVYNKSYLLLRCLSFLTGEEKFNEFLRIFYKEYDNKFASTEDFKNLLNKITEKDFTEFFNTWFYSTGTIDWQVLDLKTYKLGDLWISRVHMRREGNGVLPVEILLETSKGEKITKIYEGREKDVYLDFQTKDRVVRVELDPNSMIPDNNRLNNSYPRKIIYTSKTKRPLDAYVIHYDLLPSFSIDLSTGQITNLSYRIEGYDPITHRWSLEGLYFQDNYGNYYSGTLFQFIRYLPRDDYFGFALLRIDPLYFAGIFVLNKSFWEKFSLGTSGNLWQPAYQLNLILGYELYTYLDLTLTRLKDIYNLAMINSLNFRFSLPFQSERFYKLSWNLSKYFLIFPHSYLSINNLLGYILIENDPFGLINEYERFNLSDWKSLRDIYNGDLKWSLNINWNIPLIRDQETKFFNLFILRNINFNIFTEIGGVWNKNEGIDYKGLKIGLGIENSFNFTTFFEIPLSLVFGYAFPIYQGIENPNETGRFYTYLRIGQF